MNPQEMVKRLAESLLKAVTRYEDMLSVAYVEKHDVSPTLERRDYFRAPNDGALYEVHVLPPRVRLVRTGSWKRQRVVVVKPSSDLIAAKVALSHEVLAFPPNNGVHRILALGTEVGEAYSSAIEAVLASPKSPHGIGDWEFLLTLEHDNVPPQDGVLRLIQQLEDHPELDAVGGLYFTKGPAGVAQIWGDPRDPIPNSRPQPPDPAGGLVECCGTGMGFTLFRLSMFRDKKLRRPWFVTQKDKGGVATQDLYFWMDARKYGHRCAIDCSVRVGHYDFDGSGGGIPDYMW